MYQARWCVFVHYKCYKHLTPECPLPFRLPIDPDPFRIKSLTNSTKQCPTVFLFDSPTHTAFLIPPHLHTFTQHPPSLSFPLSAAILTNTSSMLNRNHPRSSQLAPLRQLRPVRTTLTLFLLRTISISIITLPAFVTHSVTPSCTAFLLQPRPMMVSQPALPPLSLVITAPITVLAAPLSLPGLGRGCPTTTGLPTMGAIRAGTEGLPIILHPFRLSATPNRTHWP